MTAGLVLGIYTHTHVVLIRCTFCGHAASCRINAHQPEEFLGTLQFVAVVFLLAGSGCGLKYCEQDEANAHLSPGTIKGGLELGMTKGVKGKHGDALALHPGILGMKFDHIY